MDKERSKFFSPGDFSPKTLVYSGLLSGFFCFMLLAGFESMKIKLPGSLSGELNTDTFIAAGTILLMFLCLFAVVMLLLIKLPAFFSSASRFDPLRKLPLTLTKGNRSVFISWAVIFICWLPWIILAYPANLGADSINQLFQYNTDAPSYYTTLDIELPGDYIDHHPALTTLLFGLFLDLGLLLGSANVGIFIYILLQSLLLSGALALSCCYLDKLSIAKPIRLASLIFVALFPPFAQYAATMIKDSLFSIFFILFFLGVIEIYRTEGAATKRKHFLIAFTLIACLCGLTKKTGIYIVAPTCISLLFMYRKQLRQLLAPTLTPILVSVVIVPCLIFPLLNVSPGGKQEVLGTLFQQTAAYFIYHPKEVTEEEYEIVSRILDANSFKENYRKRVTDPIKNTYDYYAKTEDIVDYLGVWVSQGMRHPDTYLQATLRISSRLMSPVKPINYYNGFAYPDEYYDTLIENEGAPSFELSKPEDLNAASDAVHKSYVLTVTSNPVLRVFFSRGLWGCWIPLFCLLFCFFKRKDSLVVFIPVLVSILFLLISPATSSRYMIPILCIAPLLIGLTGYFSTCKSSRSSLRK